MVGGIQGNRCGLDEDFVICDARDGNIFDRYVVNLRRLVSVGRP